MSDLILHNANVITMNPNMPYAKVVVIEKGRIAAVTGNENIQPAETKKTDVIDCQGRTLLPGIIDAHCHLRAYAESLVTIDLRPEKGVHSIQDIQSRK